MSDSSPGFAVFPPLRQNGFRRRSLSGRGGRVWRGGSVSHFFLCPPDSSPAPAPAAATGRDTDPAAAPIKGPTDGEGASLLEGEWRRLFVTCHLQLQPPSLSALPPLEKGLFFTPRGRRERGGEGHRPTDREATGMDGGGMMKASSFPPTGGGGGAHIRT